LAQENQELRDENLKKNELIDILISKNFWLEKNFNIFSSGALKSKSQENPGTPYSSFIQNMPNMPQAQTAREKSRTTSILTTIRGAETYDQHGSSQRIESLTDRTDRTTASPLTSVPFFPLDGSEVAGLDLKNDEQMMSTQGSAYKTVESLTKLPKLPELHNHKRGYSSPHDFNQPLPLPMVMSNKSSNVQGLDGIGSFKTLTMPIHRVSPKVFSLNLNSPTAMLPLGKVSSNKEGLTITPRTTYSQYARNKGVGEEAEAVLGLANLNINLENYKISASASQIALKKNFDNGISIPSLQLSTPFKSSQRPINDARSPIRVVDMGTSQLILTSRSKESYQETTKECKTERNTADELKEFKIQPTRIEKDPIRFKSEPPAVRAAMVKSVVSTENTTGGEEILENGSGVQQKGRFPKEVFCMSLRKKAACV